VKTDPATLLRAHGLHVTPQRLAVLKAVNRCPHGSADAIADDVRRNLGSVSVQTIYDALTTFVEQGLIRRLEPAGSPALFDPRAGDGHHHAICRTCRSVRDVESPITPLPFSTDASRPDFTVDEAEVVYWGLCAACRSAVDAPSKNAAVPRTRPRKPRPNSPEGAFFNID
jgi:Fur family ferric uptake transcriptional regulator